jgi:catechol 2,3-dioxygenase-like lactoylglutathione lyase family enzyme
MRKLQILLTLAATTVVGCLIVQKDRAAQPQDAENTPAASQRPRIVGLAHVGLFVSDISKADEFYGHILGYGHFSLDKPSGGLMLNYYKVNDHQYIEIYPGLTGDSQDRLSHIAFETTDAQKLRDYLAGKGIKVPPELKPGLDKNLSFMIDDPEGRRIEFVQYMPGSLHEGKFGALLPDTRISDHMIHAGFIVHDRAAEDHLYKDILGFQVMWYGGMKDDRVDWVDMRVPDGNDWLEYMLNVNNPSPKTRGVMNHVALGAKAIQPVYHTILDRGYKPPEPPKIGRDGKWQLNLYDPDLTRVEVMEFKPAQTPCCSPMLTGP